jgi:hypothetical protein
MSGKEQTEVNGPQSMEGSQYNKIELVWPNKDRPTVPRQLADGRWVLEDTSEAREVAPLLEVEHVGSSARASAFIRGDRLRALQGLTSGLAQSVRMIYMDLPRLRIDNEEAEFKGVEWKVHSTWLSVVREHIQAALPLLRRDGFLVANCGDLEAPYVRIVLNEIFGLSNHVGTIVWQRSYAPRNMKGMTEFTATHDFFVAFAVDRAILKHVGLKVDPEGFVHTDGDPRGPWKAEHKGAATRRESTDFELQMPPYRWRLSKGELPPGIWRVSPFTGVIWGTPSQAGNYPITIEAVDAKGDSATKRLEIVVSEDAPVGKLPPDIPWLFKPFETSGRLAIRTSKLPHGVVGAEYSALLLAEGGTPFTGKPRRPGKGRYFEFANRTMMEAYLRDDVKEDGKSIPHPKSRPPADGAQEIRNQHTWWPGKDSKETIFAGYTQDATRHLKKLEEAGLISRVTNAAKPEPLMSRVINIFSDPGDIVAEVFGEAADLSAVALKTGRRFLFLTGDAQRDRELAEECSLPRLRAVVAGRDANLESLEGDQKVAAGSYIPFSGGSGFTIATVGPWFARRARESDFPELNLEEYQGFAKLKAGVLASQGFLPSGTDRPDGLSWDGRKAAIVVPPEVFLGQSIVSDAASSLAGVYETITIFYFRCADDFEPEEVSPAVRLRRVPFELTV